jgi:DNA-binding NtrC family response regulator
MNAHQNGRNHKPLVAIVNNAVESIGLLNDVLASAGFATVEAYMIEFKRGMRDLDAFFREHRPQAVIWDIAIPYVDNWTFLQEQVLARGFLPASCFVVTTTNRTALDMLVGSTNAIELIGRPFDLDAIVQAVNRALASGGAA